MKSRRNHHISRYIIALVACLGLPSCGAGTDQSAVSSGPSRPQRVCALTLSAGAFADKYAQLGGANGTLGCPKELPVAHAGVHGAIAGFEGGALVYRADRQEAFLVTGRILDKWLAFGGGAGPLGFPTSDESDTSFLRGRLCDFDHARLTYAWGSDDVVVHDNTPGRIWP